MDTFLAYGALFQGSEKVVKATKSLKIVDRVRFSRTLHLEPLEARLLRASFALLPIEGFFSELSNDGQHVLTNGEFGAQRWTVGGAITSIGNTELIFADDISANGSVIVGSRGNTETIPAEAFRWSKPAGVPVASIDGLGVLPPFTDSKASAVSGDGRVVFGYLQGRGPTDEAPFRWSGQMTLLAKPPQAFSCFPEAATFDGSVAVGYCSRQDERGLFIGDVGVSWDSTGAHIIATASDGGRDAWATDISSDGHVVIGRGHQWEGFRIVNGQKQLLEDLPGGVDGTVPLGLSADGDVIVGVCNDSEGLQGCIWNGEGRPRKLIDCLRKQGVNLDDVRLENVSDVSADGRVVIGEIYDKSSGQLVSRIWRAELDQDSDIAVADNKFDPGVDPPLSPTLGISDLADRQPNPDGTAKTYTKTLSLSQVAPLSPTHRYVIIVADPDNGVTESDEGNNAFAVEVSCGHLLRESVLARVSPSDHAQVLATFTPNFNFSLADAQDVCGVDHFNWDQTMSPPPNWHFEIWRDAMYDVFVLPNGGQLAYPRSDCSMDALFVPGFNCGPSIHHQGNPFIPNGTLIERTTPAVVYDPVITTGHTDTYVIRVGGTSATGARYAVLPQFGEDGNTPYFTETTREWESRGQGSIDPSLVYQFRYDDRPQMPSWIWNAAGGAPWSFSTQLVGVNADGSIERFV